MTDHTSRRARLIGRGQKTQGPADQGASGHDPSGGDSDGSKAGAIAGKRAEETSTKANPGRLPDAGDVADPAVNVEADGGLTEGEAPRRWTRRAIAGGLALTAGGLAFGLWPRPERAGKGSRVVPLTPPRRPEPAPRPAPTDLRPEEMASVSPEATAPPQAEAILPEGGKAPPLKTPPGGRPQIAIVIDDLGLRHAESRRAVDLPGPLTLAFLPYGQSIAALSERARANGHEVIVHLPMEPEGRSDPGPEALRLGLGAGELEKRLTWNLAHVPGHVGVNNHMGSAMTENAAAMELVLGRLRQDGGYFLDSRTTARSTARAIAARISLPYAERDVFLDNDITAAAIERQLAETESLARRYGSAIAIGHPHAQTLKVLEAWLPKAREKGFDLVPVSAIIATRGSPLWRLARDRKGSARS